MTASATGWPALFRDAFKRSLNPMALTDANRVLIDVNPAFLKLLERRREDLIGRPLRELVEHGPLASPEQWRQALSRDEFTGTANLLRAGGETVACSSPAIPRPSPAGSSFCSWRWSRRAGAASSAGRSRAGTGAPSSRIVSSR